MAAKYKIVMVRHGESEWNKENKFCGWFDAKLSEKGIVMSIYLLYVMNITTRPTKTVSKTTYDQFCLLSKRLLLFVW